MLDSLFAGVFDTALTNVIAPADFLLCVLVSLGVGVLLCAMTLWRARSSGSFAVALALLPAVVRLWSTGASRMSEPGSTHQPAYPASISMQPTISSRFQPILSATRPHTQLITMETTDEIIVIMAIIL